MHTHPQGGRETALRACVHHPAHDLMPRNHGKPRGWRAPSISSSSVWHTPQTDTFTSNSPVAGTGRGRSISTSGDGLRSMSQQLLEHHRLHLAPPAAGDRTRGARSLMSVCRCLSSWAVSGDRPHEPGDLGKAAEQQLQQSEAGQAGGRQERKGVEHGVSVRGPACGLNLGHQGKKGEEGQMLNPGDTFQNEA